MSEHYNPLQIENFSNDVVRKIFYVKGTFDKHFINTCSKYQGTYYMDLLVL